MTQRPDSLIAAAAAAHKNARPEFSGFHVGAAIEDAEGRIFAGCNAESASYGLTICAERTALFSAIAAGSRSFRRVAVYTEAAKITTPCGACRQVMWDFCGDIEILLVNAAGDSKSFMLSQLFPEPFDAKSLS